RIAAIGSHVDLWPTITNVCSVPVDPRWQGHSLFVPNINKDRTFFRDGRCRSFGLREGRWKYFLDLDQSKQFLFDLEQEPGETKNLSADFPRTCDELNLASKGWLGRHRELTRAMSLK